MLVKQLMVVELKGRATRFVAALREGGAFQQPASHQSLDLHFLYKHREAEDTLKHAHKQTHTDRSMY